MDENNIMPIKQELEEKKVNLINLTPHDINIYIDNQIITIPSSGNIRLGSSKELAYNLNYNGTVIPIYENKYYETDSLPPIMNDTLYIVSRLVAETVKRTDFIIADDTVRDEFKTIKGCRSFAIVNNKIEK